MSPARSNVNGAETSEFPQISDDALNLRNEYAVTDDHVNENQHNAFPGRPSTADDRRLSWADGGTNGHWKSAPRRERQKSLGEAIRTVRTRNGSVSQSAAEIAQALKAPVSFKLVILCGCWYATSILSNGSSKVILTAFPKPMTLTVMQFLSVCSWCAISAGLARAFPAVREALPILKNGIRSPTKEILTYTLPLTAFQIGGHILNSDAMARIPVSLVHTIKGLSPLLTVMAYRFFYNVRYSTPTYLSLIPLTLGVIMACSASFQAEFVGILYAFGSALCFVTQNIVSKKLFNEAARAEADHTPSRFQKPDKLNLLYYSSGLALIFTLPIWLWSEGFGLIADFLADASVQLSDRPGALDHGRLALEYLFNGAFHFLQSLVAFALLGMVSPVTYSVASLMKRVFVIVFAIIWFGNRMKRIQGFGIALTVFGLYLYDRTSDAAKADKRLASRQTGAADALLPLTSVKRPSMSLSPRSPFANGSPFRGARPTLDTMSASDQQHKRHDDRPGSASASGSGIGPDKTPLTSTAETRWLPPGTKQEDTWRLDDRANAAIAATQST